MRTSWLAPAMALVLTACSFGDSRTLVLDGPPTMRTDGLGPVTSPQVVLSDGTAPEGVIYTVTPEHVASVEGPSVTALAPGEATITAAWQGQEVRWTLVVDPRVQLSLRSPPASVTIGQRQPLHLEAKMGDQVVDPGEVAWRSSADAVLTVSPAGEIQGVAVGTAYVIASRGESEAMAEITVVEAP